MDQRTKNRHREHDDHGLKNTKRTTHHQPNHEFWVCPCGWEGWLMKNDN